MDSQGNKRRRFFANSMHRDIFIVVVVAALLPTIITAVFLYYLIFSIVTEHVGIPETIAAHIIPAARQVSLILWVLIPLLIGVVLWVAHRMTHQIVGPFGRILRELDAHIAGESQKPICVRPRDKFRPLVDRINIILKKRSS